MMLLLSSVFDWYGPAFLKLYAGLMGFALLSGGVILILMRRLQQDRSAEHVNDLAGVLTPYEAAYLLGGLDRLTEAAVASLHRRGCVSVGAGKLKAEVALPGDISDVERDVYAAARARGGLSDLRSSASTSSKPIRKRLRQEGLLLTLSRKWLIRLLASLPFLIVLAVGAVKVSVGLGRDKPVGILIVLMLVTLVLGVALTMRLRTTALGSKVVKRLKQMHDPRKRAKQKEGLVDQGSPEQIAAWHCAVCGSAFVFAGIPEMNQFLSPAGSSSSSSTDGGGDGGGGCGGGCGGCGGCGG